jgi:cell wall-associated NlpC family hydrolase
MPAARSAQPARGGRSCRSLPGVLLGIGKGTTTALAVAGAALALAAGSAPAPAEAAVPWGAGCTSLPPSGVRTSGTCGASLVAGQAIAPPGAPEAVKQVIAAANQIDHRPYVWGGGHISFLTHGYDCSGAVGYALHGADLLDTTMVSGQLAAWGDAGPGRWITVYANFEHVFMVVAGLRYDTRDDPQRTSGPRWHMASVDAKGFVARHPAGL